ncbi:hypothetical protein [Halegenticoccus soli]|nr:hypothetical protein [Halegenticoccus soli]
MTDDRRDCPLCERQFEHLDDVRVHLTDDHTKQALAYGLIGATGGAGSDR